MICCFTLRKVKDWSEDVTVDVSSSKPAFRYHAVNI